MNIHGKNNYYAGTFGEHVLDFDLLTVAGEQLRCSREENPDLFHAVIGGAGLLGVVSRLRLRLKRVESGLLRVTPLATRSLVGMMDAIEERKGSADYLVGWVDCWYGGRGQIHRGLRAGRRGPDRRRLAPRGATGIAAAHPRPAAGPDVAADAPVLRRSRDAGGEQREVRRVAAPEEGVPPAAGRLLLPARLHPRLVAGLRPRRPDPGAVLRARRRRARPPPGDPPPLPRAGDRLLAGSPQAPPPRPLPPHPRPRRLVAGPRLPGHREPSRPPLEARPRDRRPRARRRRQLLPRQRRHPPPRRPRAGLQGKARRVPRDQAPARSREPADERSGAAVVGDGSPGTALSRRSRHTGKRRRAGTRGGLRADPPRSRKTKTPRAPSRCRRPRRR